MMDLFFIEKIRDKMIYFFENLKRKNKTKNHGKIRDFLIINDFLRIF